MTKLPALVLALAGLAVGLTACGGSSKSASSSSPATSSPGATSTSPAPSGGGLTLAADPSGQLKFTTTSLTAKAGKVTIQFTNSSPTAHNLTIEQGASGPVLGATPTFQGGTKTLAVNLKPGTYTFFCSVPGHRAAGMHGTLTIG